VTTLIFIIGIFCIILGLITSVFISKTISKPLKYLAEIMSEAGQGDLEVRAVVNRSSLLRHSFLHL